MDKWQIQESEKLEERETNPKLRRPEWKGQTRAS